MLRRNRADAFHDALASGGWTFTLAVYDEGLGSGVERVVGTTNRSLLSNGSGCQDGPPAKLTDVYPIR